jgi:hypothetical protein
VCACVRARVRASERAGGVVPLRFMSEMDEENHETALGFRRDVRLVPPRSKPDSLSLLVVR